MLLNVFSRCRQKNSMEDEKGPTCIHKLINNDDRGLFYLSFLLPVIINDKLLKACRGLSFFLLFWWMLVNMLCLMLCWPAFIRIEGEEKDSLSIQTAVIDKCHIFFLLICRLLLSGWKDPSPMFWRNYQSRIEAFNDNVFNNILAKASIPDWLFLQVVGEGCSYMSWQNITGPIPVGGVSFVRPGYVLSGCVRTDGGVKWQVSTCCWQRKCCVLTCHF